MNAPVKAQDQAQECRRPAPPVKPYTDLSTAIFIAQQDHTIGICRALLGHEEK